MCAILAEIGVHMCDILQKYEKKHRFPWGKRCFIKSSFILL